MRENSLYEAIESMGSNDFIRNENNQKFVKPVFDPTTEIMADSNGPVFESMHSELKFQKKSNFKSTKTFFFLTFSKVQKHIFCYFKNGKKSIFVPKRCLKLRKMQFLD